MIKNVLDFKYFSTFYLFIIVSLCLNLLIFYSLIENPLTLPTKALGPITYAIINCIIIAFPYFFIKKKHYFFITYLFCIDILLLANTIYFRYFDNVIPFYSYSDYSNLGEMTATLPSYFRITDFYFFISTFFLLISYVFIFRKKMENVPIKFRLKTSITLFILSILIGSSGFVIGKMKGVSVDQKVFNKDNNQPAFVSNYGIISLWIYQVISYLYSDNMPLNGSDFQDIKSFIIKNKSQNINIESNKNLIIIIVESLDTWVTKYSNGEATPFLNKLSISDSVIFVPNVLPQICNGRSSDAQLIINTGLLPIKNNTVASLYSKQYFPSIAQALKNEKKYFSLTIMGNKSTFWNQKTMNIAYNIDSLISIEQLNANEIIGYGISDKSMFLQASRILNSNRNKKTYTQIITLSSHDGIDFNSKPTTLKFPPNYTNEIKNYIKAIEYTDGAIELFFNELKRYNIFKNTIILITADHQGLSSGIIKPFLPNLINSNENSNNTFTPLYIVNSGLKYKQKINQTIGEIDIYPTLLDIMGVKHYSWRGVGKSIFSLDYPTFAIDKNFNIIGDTTNTTKENIQHKINAWTISDLMIRKKYFNTTKKDKI